MAAPATPPSTVILTGANGRLAACIRPHLQAAGKKVLGYSQAAGGGHAPLARLLSEPWTEPATALLHLAWSTLPATSEKEIGAEWSRDLPLIFQLLQRIVDTPAAMRPHFIFFSSGGAVYGPVTDRPARESDPCRPIGWYAEAKLAAEEIINIYAQRHGLACTILRISNPYGFSVPANRGQGLIPRAFYCARSGEPLPLWGDGSARKDFLHYTDFNRALQQVIDRRLTGTFNLAAGASSRVQDVIAGVEKVTGRAIRLLPQPAPAWDVQSSLLDNSKLCAAADWNPAVGLEAGLHLMARELEA
jgi:UDP-glucose 4-epimerase